MKKSFIALFIVGVALSFAACAKKEGESKKKVAKKHQVAKEAPGYMMNERMIK